MPYPMDPGDPGDDGLAGPVIRTEHISVTEIFEGKSYEFEQKVAEALRRIKPRAKNGIVNVAHSMSVDHGFFFPSKYIYSAILTWEEA